MSRHLSACCLYYGNDIKKNRVDLTNVLACTKSRVMMHDLCESTASTGQTLAAMLSIRRENMKQCFRLRNQKKLFSGCFHLENITPLY